MLPLDVVLQIADGNDADYAAYRHRGRPWPRYGNGSNFQKLFWLARDGTQTTYLHPLRCTNSTNGTHVKTGNGNMYKQCDELLGHPSAIEGFEVRSDCEEACNHNPDCVGYTATAPNSQNCSLLGIPNPEDQANHQISFIWRFRQN
jgi:hypothetical protein